jgi:hypothetical protein
VAAGLGGCESDLPSIVIDGWSQEGCVYFRPEGQESPVDEVGRIVVAGASGALPARVCRDRLDSRAWLTK